MDGVFMTHLIDEKTFIMGYVDNKCFNVDQKIAKAPLYLTLHGNYSSNTEKKDEKMKNIYFVP